MGVLPPTVTPTIRAEHLVKSYAGKKAVDDVSFDVMPGDTFAFLGPNGAGKTTTIKMLTTLLPVDSGRILIDGFDLATQPMEARKKFGVVFQDCTLDSTMTVYENLWMHCAFYKIPRKRRAESINTMLAVFEISKRRDDVVSKLSGGLKRRIEIARALLHGPSLLFLDEPTMGLDTKSRRVLWEYLANLKHEFRTTIFLTTHYLDEVERFSEKVAVINQGKMIAQGGVQDVIRQTGTSTLEDSFLSLTEVEGVLKSSSTFDRPTQHVPDEEAVAE